MAVTRHLKLALRKVGNERNICCARAMADGLVRYSRANIPLPDATGTGTLACAVPYAGERRPAPISQSLPPHASHTFGVTDLRNGGDVFSLQRLLGYSTMDMVKRYLSLAAVDMDEVHRKAMPENADGWADCSCRFALNRANACATLHSPQNSKRRGNGTKYRDHC